MDNLKDTMYEHNHHLNVSLINKKLESSQNGPLRININMYTSKLLIIMNEYLMIIILIYKEHFSTERYVVL